MAYLSKITKNISGLTFRVWFSWYFLFHMIVNWVPLSLFLSIYQTESDKISAATVSLSAGGLFSNILVWQFTCVFVCATITISGQCCVLVQVDKDTRHPLLLEQPSLQAAISSWRTDFELQEIFRKGKTQPSPCFYVVCGGSKGFVLTVFTFFYLIFHQLKLATLELLFVWNAKTSHLSWNVVTGWC